MKLKRLQLSLGSLFLATLMFGLGIVVGLRFNVREQEHQAREKTLRNEMEKMEVEGAVIDARYKAVRQILVDREATIRTQAEELRRLKDERGE